MTYNIEIFKSASYRKILKEVLKFRYPDLSYEKALYTERLIPDCLVCCSTTYNPLMIINSHHFNTLIQVRPKGELIRSEQICEDKPTAILGRPITICEIVDVLEEVSFTGYPYEYSLQSLIYFSKGIEDENDDEITGINFQPKTYYLHEQTLETIDKIAELLD
jgi:hypothetical protein